LVVKVPSAEIARVLYDSDEYAPFEKARAEQLTDETHFAILPGSRPGG
jgi:uncharacterized protein (DUF1330 family)